MYIPWIYCLHLLIYIRIDTHSNPFLSLDYSRVGRSWVVRQLVIINVVKIDGGGGGGQGLRRVVQGYYIFCYLSIRFESFPMNMQNALLQDFSGSLKLLLSPSLLLRRGPISMTMERTIARTISIDRILESQWLWKTARCDATHVSQNVHSRESKFICEWQSKACR